MKPFRFSLLCLLLSLVLILSLAGCRQEPADPTNGPTPTTAPTQPTDSAKPTNPSIPTDPTVPASNPADEYASAAQNVNAKNALFMDLFTDITMTVAGDTFHYRSTQQLSYSDRQSGSPRIQMLETIIFDHNAMPHLRETYIDGTLYVQYDVQRFFCGPMDKEVCRTRYVPAVMFSTSLYGSITSEPCAKGTAYIFSQPSGAESWALPEGAVFSDASGRAEVNSENFILETNYTITYRYGGVTMTVEYQSRVREDSGSITVYGNVSDYIQVPDPTFFRYIPRSLGYTLGLDSAKVTATESIFSQAAGVARNQTINMRRYGQEKGTSALIETDVYLMNYATNEEQTYSLVEKYIDLLYTVTENGGQPISYTAVPYATIATYCHDILCSYSMNPNDWQDISCTDLGSTVLFEFALDEHFAISVQADICATLWNDRNFLNNLSTKYVTNEITGYLAIDKFTGLPTARGYNYSGTHTIYGDEYLLTIQADQSIEIPGMEAYYDINEKVPQEQPPEQKAKPLFYHVTGTDGQEMWLFGTIHIGDVRTGYLPQEIYDALAASDALALECDNELFEKLSETDEAVQAQLSEVYFLPDGTTLESVLGEELYEMALKYMKASGNYNMNAPYMKPFAWNSALTDFQAQQSYALVRSQGVESRLTALAKEQNKPILEIESAMFQLQMMANFSPELQIYMLMSTLHTDTLQAREELLDLYEKWCAGDEAALRKAVSTQVDTSGMTAEEKTEYEQYKYLIDEYNKAMDGDRNKGMLEVAKSYLESDQVVFYAVGLAHLLSEDGGLVDALRAAGYTVELVQYK